jgi:hypothetical protein
MANMGGKRITDTFHFKHHAIPVLEITATDRIISATTRLTVAIANAQDSPPNKMEAIQSLCTLLLGEAALLPPPTPSILPTPPPPTPVVKEDEPRHHLESSTCSACIANPQCQYRQHLLQMQHSCHRQGQWQRQQPCPQSMHPITLYHLVCPLQNRPLTHNQLRLRSVHMINCVIAEELMPTPALCPCPPSLCHRYAFVAECILPEHISPPSHSTVHFIGTIINNDISNILKYCHLMKMDKHKKGWAHSFTNEIGHLLQGIRNRTGTDTCFFIPKSLVPAHKCPTYRRICCNYQPQKEEKHCVRLTVGGNWIDYPGNKSTPMADLTTAKLLINSTISNPGAKFLGIDLTNFYLNTPMPNPE